MGVYDFFKGKCPECQKQIDQDPEYGKCGDIQTKYFILEVEYCFRYFYPDQKVPFVPHENFIIGRTCCCNTLIKAFFDQDLLLEYVVAHGRDRFKYIEREMKQYYDQSRIPQKDRDWYNHKREFQKNQIEEHIIQQAWHPDRISHYLDLGYSLDEICSP
jgi:hypothetical protein